MFRLWTFYLLLLSHFSHGQLSYSWVNIITSGGLDNVSKIIASSTGNVYILGKFSGTSDFDPSASNSYLTPSNNFNSFNSFIAKYTNNGSFVWAKRLGNSTGDGQILDFTIDANENIYISGGFNGILDFDLDAPTYTLNSNVSSPSNDGQVFFAKYNSNGGFLSASTNSLVLVNVFQGRAGFLKYNNNNVYCLLNSTYESHLMKYSNSGTLISSKTFTTSFGGAVSLNEIAINSLGDIVIVGNFQTTINVDPAVSNYSLTGGMSNTYLMASCYDGNLNFKWAQKIGSSFPGNTGASLVIDNLDNIYLTGGEETKIQISKLDNNGNLIWYNKLGPNSGNSHGSSIKLSCSNKLFLIGTFTNLYGAVDFDPSPSTFTLSQQAGINQKVFFASYNLDGSFNTGVSLAENADVKSGFIDTNDDLYIGGSFTSSSDFDPGPSVVSFTADPNFSDAFFGKYMGCLLSGIVQNSISLAVKVFPNPTKNTIIVDIENNNPFLVEVFDIYSQKLISHSTSSKQIDLTEIPSGLYFLKVSQNSSSFLTKIIKE